VCVCVCERESERERKKERIRERERVRVEGIVTSGSQPPGDDRVYAVCVCVREREI